MASVPETNPNRTASSRETLGSQRSDVGPQEEGQSNEPQLTGRADHVQGSSSHRPRPRQPQRKGATVGTGKGQTKEKVNSQRKGKGQAKSRLPAIADSNSNRTGPDAVKSNVGSFRSALSCRSIASSDTTQHQTSRITERKNGNASQGPNRTTMSGASVEESGRPTNRTIGRVAGHSSAQEPLAGRKSGRLREKGPTTYTAKGEIIRGGKRVNDEIHEQPFAKRVRYET